MEFPVSTLSRNPKQRLREYQDHNAVLEVLRVDGSTNQWQGTSQHQSAEWRDEVMPSPSNTMWERVQAVRAQREAKQREREEAFKLATQRKKEEADARREAAFQEDYEDVLAGLAADNESGHIMGDTQYTLEHKSKISTRKRRDLHTEWETQVFDRIQGRLQSAMTQRSPRDFTQRLKSQGDAYIRTTNTKLGVFRDVIIESDYNPLEAHQHTIKIPTGDIRDPLKRDMLKPQQEAQLMGMPTATHPLGKVTLSTSMWDDLHIHATPYGHCMDRSGQYVVRPMSGRVVEARKSHIPLDHYNYPNHDNDAINKELGKPGRRLVPGPEQLRGRAGLTEVIQYNCKPGETGGDLWLEAKGKARAPGPEERRGRVDFGEVIAQSSNPYQDGRTVGDQWLEAKGKAKPPGPEQRRGRADLTEIIAQASNPYQDGRSLGDQWLETKGKAPLAGPKETLREFINRMDSPPLPPPPKNPKANISVLMSELTLHPRVGG